MAKLLAPALALAILSLLSQARAADTYFIAHHTLESSDILLEVGAYKSSENTSDQILPKGFTHIAWYNWSVSQTADSLSDKAAAPDMAWDSRFATLGSGTDQLSASGSARLLPDQESVSKITLLTDGRLVRQNMGGRNGVYWVDTVESGREHFDGYRNPVYRGGVPYGDAFTVDRSRFKIKDMFLTTKVRTRTSLSVGNDVSLQEYDAIP